MGAYPAIRRPPQFIMLNSDTYTTCAATRAFTSVAQHHQNSVLCRTTQHALTPEAQALAITAATARYCHL